MVTGGLVESCVGGKRICEGVRSGKAETNINECQ